MTNREFNTLEHNWKLTQKKVRDLMITRHVPLRSKDILKSVLIAMSRAWGFVEEEPRDES